MIGQMHENGWTVTPDMANHVQGYVEMIRARGGTISTEQHVKLTDYITGTLDSSVEVTGSTLFVDDLKYGMKIVEAYENTQLLIYAGAKIATLANAPERVVLSIYQPRAFHPEGIHRSWELTSTELSSYVRWIIERGQACQSPTPIATPGKHCDHCTARTSCAALAATNYAFYDVVEDTRQRHMNSEELARELDFLKRADEVLKARKSAVEAEAVERIRQGEFLPGWFMKPRKGNRAFTVDPETIRLMTGVDPYDKKTVTPAELERRGANPEIVAKISRAPDIAPKLDKVPHNYFKRMMEK